MKKSVCTLNFSKVVVALLCFFQLASFAQTYDSKSIDGRIFIKYKDEVKLTLPKSKQTEVNSLPFVGKTLKQFSVKSVECPFYNTGDFNLERTFRIYFSKYDEVEELIKELVKLPEIEYAEKEPYHRIFYSPNDSYYGTGYMWHWYLNQINASQAWDVCLGDADIKIAIVDNAFYSSHEDLDGKIYAKYDVADGDPNVDPPSNTYIWSHGTHCAGLAGAETNNGTGMPSIGGNVELILVKCATDASGGTGMNSGLSGVQWAADNGADVISLSYGSDQYSTTEKNLMDWAKDTKGCVIVAAGGNDGTSTTIYPAGYSSVIGVASVNSDDEKSDFSNYGNYIDISAPGGYFVDNADMTLLSTTACPSTNTSAGFGSLESYGVYGRYNLMKGTSMAAPITAGLCGLMLSENPTLSPDEIASCLYSSAHDIDSENPSYIGNLGAGRIDAYEAMQCVSVSLPPVATFSANSVTVSLGGTVDFSDLSANSPSSWYWTFEGGTPSASIFENPSVVYNSAGTYDVTLIVTNAYGSDTLTKSNYISVIESGGCDTTSNLLADDTLTIYTFSSAWGFVSGHNEYNYSGFAEKYSGLINGYIYGVYLPVGIAYNASPSSYISLKVWDGGTTPGSELYSQNEEINLFTESSWNYVPFDSPVAVSGDVYVGLEINYSTPLDTFVVFLTKDRGGGQSNTAYYLEEGTWYPFTNIGLRSTLGFQIPVCDNASVHDIVANKDRGKLLIYPNPVNEQFNIDMISNETGDVIVNIFDVNGKKLWSRSFHNNDKRFITTIGTGFLTKGIYVLELKTDKEIYREQLIKY